MCSTYFELLILLSTALVVNGQLKCLTSSDSKDPKQPCIFPFKFKGTKYNGCPPDPEVAGRRWCSTAVDNRGNHITGGGKFGFCEESCPHHKEIKRNYASLSQNYDENSISTRNVFVPKEDPYAKCKTKGGEQCQFPFHHEGVLYTGCPPDPVEAGERWCSTKVDKKGNHITGKGFYGLCKSNCPIHKPTSFSVSKCGSGKTCRPTVQCSAQIPDTKDLKNSMCQMEDGSTGTCCGDVPKSWGPMADKVVQRGGIAASFVPERRTITINIPNNKKLSMFDRGISWAKNITNYSRRVKVATSSTSLQHASFLKSKPGAYELGMGALADAYTTKLMLEDQGIDPSGDEAVLGLVGFLPSDTGTLEFNTCPFTDPAQTPDCDPNAKYRTIQGECNNLRQPFFGKAFTPFGRILDPAFEDGILEPRSKAASGRPLPGARVVSTTFRLPATDIKSPDFTNLLVGFGQFLSHDNEFTPITQSADREPVECCEDGQFRPLTSKSEFERMICIPIEVPRSDILPTRCINLVRSIAVNNLECSGGPIEQINQISHWFDASNIYGSVPSVQAQVRSFKDGLLDAIIGADGKEQLPIDPLTTCRGRFGTCAFAGDSRVNELPTLGSFHILWLREHNRIARELKQINPRWDDEKLFQETRRIVNAELVHMIYNEWLPILIGPTFLEEFGLKPLTSGFSKEYRSDFDPRVTNEFAAGGFRVGHTLIPDILKTFDAITSRAKKEIDVEDAFADSDILREPGFVDELVKGMTMQPSQLYDNNFVNAITTGLFDGEMGLDLIAINIQRGRDHGLQPYLKYRHACGTAGGGTITSFDQLSTNISPERIQRLKDTYDSVDDIDLFPGLIMEEAFEDAQIGETFVCLISDTFARLRFGDRFFYDNGGQAGSFTLPQLDQIRRFSMARLICDNTRITEIQPLAFRQSNDDTNRLTGCASRLFLQGIPSVDLSVFRE